MNTTCHNDAFGSHCFADGNDTMTAPNQTYHDTPGLPLGLVLFAIVLAVHLARVARTRRG